MSLDPVMEEAASAASHLPAGMTEFRQLRHQTKNALQHIVMQVLELSELDSGRGLIGRDLMRRIELTAAISDALFGFRQSPEPLAARLNSLSQSVIALHTDGTQHIDLSVTVAGQGSLSRSRNDLILRIAHELVMNAVKHGMYLRLVGRISIRLDIGNDGGVLLAVSNDGWWMADLPHHGGGLEIVEELARTEGGDMRITIRPQSLIEVHLPPEPRAHSKSSFGC